VGDRICISGVNVRPEWVQLEVKQVGVDFVRTANFSAYTNYVAATPGGPLAQPVFDALESMFDALGPSSRTGSYVVRRHPDPSTLWPNGLTVATVIEKINALPGVANVSVSAPAADVTPSLGLTSGLGRVIINHG